MLMSPLVVIATDTIVVAVPIGAIFVVFKILMRKALRVGPRRHRKWRIHIETE
jgi:hypothetical protein